MHDTLPYRAVAASGRNFDIAFPLHPETAARADVADLLTVVLHALDRHIRNRPALGNGDVLQALAMAMAVRTLPIPAPVTVVGPLALDLLATALDAAERALAGSGHAPGHA